MYEGDAVPSGARTRLPVDEAEALGLERGEGGANVLHPEGDVMEPRAATRQESSDRGVGR
jgi:hypothetical protein